VMTAAAPCEPAAKRCRTAVAPAAEVEMEQPQAAQASQTGTMAVGAAARESASNYPLLVSAARKVDGAAAAATTAEAPLDPAEAADKDAANGVAAQAEPCTFSVPTGPPAPTNPEQLAQSTAQQDHAGQEAGKQCSNCGTHTTTVWKEDPATGVSGHSSCPSFPTAFVCDLPGCTTPATM
jgi:hypothetical protein